MTVKLLTVLCAAILLASCSSVYKYTRPELLLGADVDTATYKLGKAPDKVVERSVGGRILTWQWQVGPAKVYGRRRADEEPARPVWEMLTLWTSADGLITRYEHSHPTHDINKTGSTPDHVWGDSERK